MHRLVGVASVALCLALFTSEARAQTCLGRPFFSTGSLQLGGVVQLGNNRTLIGAEGAFGKDRSFFLQGLVARESIDASVRDDPSGTAFGIGAGYQAASASRVQVCPYVTARTTKFDDRITQSQAQISAMFGFAPRDASDVHFVPFGGLGIGQMSLDFDDDDRDGFSRGDDTYFPLTLGLGAHLTRRFALIADLVIPIDLGSTRPILGVRGVYAFGN